MPKWECPHCGGLLNPEFFKRLLEAISEVEARCCDNCKHIGKANTDEPCIDCIYKSAYKKWEPDNG